jgi:hypothetical protein
VQISYNFNVEFSCKNTSYICNFKIQKLSTVHLNEIQKIILKNNTLIINLEYAHLKLNQNFYTLNVLLFLENEQKFSLRPR